MLIPIILLITGLIILTIGADRFIQGAAGIAEILGMSPLMVGLTIVGIGTSAPELAVSILAALRGTSDLAAGNVVGSNISNIGLILGSGAVLVPLTVHMKLLRIEVPILIGAAFLFWALCADGSLDRRDAGFLLLCMAGFLAVVYQRGRAESAAIRAEIRDVVPDRPSLAPSVVSTIFGLAALIIGANLIVEGAVRLAQLWNVSDVLIGLTIVAVGTSLPELASSIAAVRRNQPDIAVGNVIGSNIANVFLILGTTAMARPMAIDPILLRYDVPLMAGFSAMLFPMMWRGFRVSRGEGVVLLGCFIAYTVWRVNLALTLPR